MASVKVTCPACKASLQVGPDLLGKAIKCPKCKKPFKSPATATAPPAKPLAASAKPTIEPNKYVVARGAKKFGPYTMSQLKQLVELGKLNPDDQLRKGTTGDWEAASDLPGLFPESISSLDADDEENLFGDAEDEAPAPVKARPPVRKPAIAEDDEETIAEDEEEETPAPRGKGKKPVRVAVDDDDEDAKPAKKKKGGGLLLVLLLLLVIGAGGGAAWWFFLGGQEMFNPQPIAKINTPLADSTKKGSPIDTPKADEGNKDNVNKDDAKKDDGKKDDGKKDDGKDGKIEEKKIPENPLVAGSNDIELKYLSDAIQGVAVVNVQRLLRSPLAKEFDAMSVIRSKVPTKEIDKVDRVVFYVEPVPAGKFPASFGFLVRTSEPIDPKIFVDKKAEETTFEGKKAWKVTEEGLDIYVLQHDDKTYVGGVEGTLKKMLAGGDASPLRTKFGAMDPNSADLLLAGVLDSANDEALPLRKTLIAMTKDLPEPFKKLEDVAPKLTAVSLTLDLSGSNLLAAAFDLADEEAAQSLKSVGTDGVNFVKTFLRPVAAKMVEEKSPPELKKLAIAVMDDVFNGMSVAQLEKSVTASIPNPKSLPELIKQAAPMIQKLFGDKKEAAPPESKQLESRLRNGDAERQTICFVAPVKLAGRPPVDWRLYRTA